MCLFDWYMFSPSGAIKNRSSPQFKDLVLIAPEGLNDIPIDTNYKEIQANKSKRHISTTHIIFARFMDTNEMRVHCHHNLW